MAVMVCTSAAVRALVPARESDPDMDDDMVAQSLVFLIDYNHERATATNARALGGYSCAQDEAGRPGRSPVFTARHLVHNVVSRALQLTCVCHIWYGLGGHQRGAVVPAMEGAAVVERYVRQQAACSDICAGT
jgi:hypothetical protein